MSNHNIEDWLVVEVGEEMPGGQPPQTVPGPNVPDPNIANMPPGQMNQQPNTKDPNAQQSRPNPPDASSDPMVPDMPDDAAADDLDFEKWKDLYFREAVKGDTGKLIDMIHQVRDLDLEPYPRKFVEDNLQVQFLRQYANVDKASKEIRKQIREELDQNNPAVSIVNHIDSVLQTMPELNNVFIKLKGTLGMKGDLHRKFIASLLGAVQVGTGGDNEDVVYSEKTYSIKISTRYCDRWGRTDIGRWSLRKDDPERYLSDPEQKKLEEGSPEEKEVLRKRIVMESIAETFKQRAFIVNSTSSDGTIYTLGWDLAGSLRSAYTDGKLVVRTIESENAEAMITDDGQIIPYVDMKIRYARETGQTDENGKPELEEHDFLERIDGLLFLTAQFQILREAASSFGQGMVLKEIPYSGAPSDLTVLTRCLPSSTEILFRNC